MSQPEYIFTSAEGQRELTREADLQHYGECAEDPQSRAVDYATVAVIGQKKAE